MVFIFQKANARLAKRGGRTMAITPRHYLDFINHYADLFHEKRSELEEQQMHLNVGLRKIKETVDQVRRGASGPRWEGAGRVLGEPCLFSVALMWRLLLRWKSCVGTSG